MNRSCREQYPLRSTHAYKCTGPAVGTLHALTITPRSSTDNAAMAALTPLIVCSSRRQEERLSNAGSFVFLRRTRAEFLCLGASRCNVWASPCNVGASPCRPCTASLMVNLIPLSSLKLGERPTILDSHSDKVLKDFIDQKRDEKMYKKV